MRSLHRSKDFDRDFRKVDLTDDLLEVLSCLAHDLPLDPRFKDHKLVSNWEGYRECHVKSDLLLVYRLEGDDVLKLARLNSHSEVFKTKKSQK